MSHPILHQLLLQLLYIVVLLLRILHLLLLPCLSVPYLLPQHLYLVIMLQHSSLQLLLSRIILQLLCIIKRIFRKHRQLILQFFKMSGLLLKNILQPRHLISNKSPRLLTFQIINIPLIILNLLIHILQLLLNRISTRLCRNQFILLFCRSILILLLLQHLIYFYNLILQLTVALLQLLNVFSSISYQQYLISSDSFYFSLILCLLE